MHASHEVVGNFYGTAWPPEIRNAHVTFETH